MNFDLGQVNPAAGIARHTDHALLPPEAGWLPMKPMRKNRKVGTVVDLAICTLPNMVERCFNKMKNSRRLATCYIKPQTVCSASSTSPASASGSVICQYNLAAAT